jgi:hypothetical protein
MGCFYHHRIALTKKADFLAYGTPTLGILKDIQS